VNLDPSSERAGSSIPLPSVGRIDLYVLAQPA
jgi:hypothetical protein